MLMSTRKNTIANYFGQGWTALMGLAFVPIYIDYLGVEAWGLVGFMTMMQAWLTLLDMGLSPALSREMSRYKAGEHSALFLGNLLRSLELIYIGVAFTIIVSVWLIAPWLAAHWLRVETLGADTVSKAIGLMGLVLAAKMVEQVYRGVIQGAQMQVWLNCAQSIMVALRWGGAVAVLKWVDSSVDAFFLWQGGVSLLTVLVLARQTYLILPTGMGVFRFDWAVLKQIRRFAGGMFVTTLLALILTQVDKLLLTRLVSLQDFGLYMLANSVAGALYFLVMPISSAVLPRLTELVTLSDENALIHTYHSACQWVAAIMIPIALVIAAYSESLLLAWTGEADLSERACQLVSFLALGTMCNGLMHVPYALQLAYGWTGFAIRTNILAVVFFIPAIFWMVPRFGAVGAAWVWLVLNLGYVFISAHYMYRRLLPKEKLRWYKDAIFKPLVSGAITLTILKQLFVLPHNRLEVGISLAGIAFVAIFVGLISVPVSQKFLRFHLLSSRAEIG